MELRITAADLGSLLVDERSESLTTVLIAVCVADARELVEELREELPKASWC